jgi:hypothetical protein
VGVQLEKLQFFIQCKTEEEAAQLLVDHDCDVNCAAAAVVRERGKAAGVECETKDQLPAPKSTRVLRLLRSRLCRGTQAETAVVGIIPALATAAVYGLGDAPTEQAIASARSAEEAHMLQRGAELHASRVEMQSLTVEEKTEWNLYNAALGVNHLVSQPLARRVVFVGAW